MQCSPWIRTGTRRVGESFGISASNSGVPNWNCLTVKSSPRWRSNNQGRSDQEL